MMPKPFLRSTQDEYQTPRGNRRDRSQSGLSLIIPAYNASATIGITLMSAVLFKPRNSEILVYIDGGSTQSRFMSYAASKNWIKIFRSSETKGLSHGLNILISKSTKNVIARLDHDDVMLPFQLSKALRIIKKGKLDIVFSNAVLFGSGLRFLPFLPQTPFSIRANDSARFLAIENPFVHPTMVARKSSILDLGGYRNTIGEDYELWLRASLAGLRISKLRGFGVLYRLHAGQMTSDSNFSPLVATNSDIREHRRKLMLSLGYKVTEESIDEVAQKISMELERSNFGFRWHNWVRRMTLIFSNKFLSPKKLD
jgi:glycosyltransferase involved in cell wall biosynthesis